MLKAARADKTKPYREEHALLSIIWERPEYIDAYLEERESSLARGTVKSLKKWRKYYVPGPFFIERFTKEGAVFISVQSGQVYLVSGITSDVEGVDEKALPFLVETALLPYKGRIVYDGMMQAISELLDSDGKKQLSGVYEYAKEEDHIITALPPANPAVENGQWELMIRAIMPSLQQKASQTELAQQLSDDAEVHLIPPENLVTLDKLLRKLRRSQKDWDKIQDILFAGDVITAEPMFESEDVQGVEHILCDHDVLLVFTTAEKCQNYILRLNKGYESNRYFQIVTMPYETAVQIADDTRKKLFVDFHPDRRFKRFLAYDSQTSRITANMLL